MAVASWGQLRMISPGLFAVPDVWARREGGAAKAGARCAGEFQELKGSFCQTMMDTHPAAPEPICSSGAAGDVVAQLPGTNPGVELINILKIIVFLSFGSNLSNHHPNAGKSRVSVVWSLQFQ